MQYTLNNFSLIFDTPPQTRNSNAFSLHRGEELHSGLKTSLLRGREHDSALKTSLLRGREHDSALKTSLLRGRESFVVKIKNAPLLKRGISVFIHFPIPGFQKGTEMYHIYTKWYRTVETLGALRIFLEVLLNRHTDNVFIVKAVEKLVELEKALTESKAYHDKNTLAEQSDQFDSEFNTVFTQLLNAVELFSGVEGYGRRSRACGMISSIIATQNRNLHRCSKQDQITLFDNVIMQCKPHDENSLVDVADVRPIFEKAMEHHNNLKSVEKARAINTAQDKKVPAPYEVTKEINPLINTIYEHIVAFSDLDEPEYKETLDQIMGHMKPLVTKIKRRITAAEAVE